MSISDSEKSISENDVLKILDETSRLAARYNINQLSSAAVSAQSSNALTNNVEFWKWMSRNYSSSGIFDSSASMQQYISQGAGKEEWLAKQIQGKGYEWDWMKAQRDNIKNIFKTYDAGDIANRTASDVTERGLITGSSREYQMKAYTSKTNPDLKNTPKDMTVVTNTEKAKVVRDNGHQNVKEFQNNKQIKRATDKRMEQIKDGRAYTTYNFRNVAGTMAKAGLVGCAFAMGTEAVVSYRAWKSGQLTDDEYLKEILKSGGDAGVTAASTAGVMIPVSAAITAVGASTLLTIPVAFVLSAAISKIVAPCFGRGQYKELLSKAKYYQNLENVYDDLVSSMQNASEQYYDFVSHMSQQNAIHQEMKRKSMEMNSNLKNLYDSI